MVKALEFILKKFPDHSAKIMDLYERDDDFRTLCDDYLTSAEALNEYRVNSMKNRGFEMDFLQVNLELEKEIVGLLEASR